MTLYSRLQKVVDFKNTIFVPGVNKPFAQPIYLYQFCKIIHSGPQVMRRVIQNRGKSSWKSHCVTCVLARLIVYFWQVTGSWKGPISQNNPK